MSAAKILSHPPSVNENESFDVGGSYDGCDSPTVTATMNGSPLSVTLTSSANGSWTAEITAGPCVAGKLNTIKVTVTCGEASDDVPIAVNCS